MIKEQIVQLEKDIHFIHNVLSEGTYETLGMDILKRLVRNTHKNVYGMLQLDEKNVILKQIYYRTNILCKMLTIFVGNGCELSYMGYLLNDITTICIQVIDSFEMHQAAIITTLDEGEN